MKKLERRIVKEVKKAENPLKSGLGSETTIEEKKAATIPTSKRKEKRIPIFADHYLPFFKRHKPLLQIYRRWERDRSFSDNDWIQLYVHLFPCRKGEDKIWLYPEELSEKDAKSKLESLRKDNPEGKYRLLLVSRDRWTVVNVSVYHFILEERLWMGIFESVANDFGSYYQKEMPSEEKFGRYVHWALLMAIFKTHPRIRILHLLNVIKHDSFFAAPENLWYVRGYHSWSDIYQRFKECLWQAIGTPTAGLSEIKDDTEFCIRFEDEWRRIKQFSDASYDFTVCPSFTHSDMIRYACLQEKPNYVVWEMIDYTSLKICPKLWQTIDHIEPERFWNWEKLLLGLFLPTIREILEAQKPTKRELTPTEKESVKKEIISDIIKLATEEYVYIYKHEGSQKKTSDLLNEIETLETKLSKPGLSVSKREELHEKVNRLIERASTLKYKDFQAHGAWVTDFKISRPIGLLTDLSLRPEDLDNASWRQKQIAKWVRPSYFICQNLYKEYLPEKYHDYYKPPRGGIQSYEAMGADAIGVERKGGKDKLIIDKKYKKGETSRYIIRLPDGDYYTVEGLAERVGCTPKTLRRWDKKGEIKFIHKGAGRERAMRLFPVEESEAKIEKLKQLLRVEFNDKTFAKVLGIHEKSLSRIKRKTGINRLPRIEQKERLIDMVRAKRKR